MIPLCTCGHPRYLHFAGKNGCHANCPQSERDHVFRRCPCKKFVVAELERDRADLG